MNDKDFKLGLDIEDWKERILDSYDSYTSLWEDNLTTESQLEMLERVLINWKGSSEDKRVLDRVLEEGKYKEEDKEILNRARREYLKED